MKMPMVVATVLLATATFADANASEEAYCEKSDQSTWMSDEAVQAKYEALGYDVRDVDNEHGCLEIKGFDKDGKRVELYLDPVSGDLVKSKE